MTSLLTVIVDPEPPPDRWAPGFGHIANPIFPGAMPALLGLPSRVPTHRHFDRSGSVAALIGTIRPASAGCPPTGAAERPDICHAPQAIRGIRTRRRNKC
jgi:hypothetical protein